MNDRRIPSLVYEPEYGPSLFERWEADPDSYPPAPPAIRDIDYRRWLLEVFATLDTPGRSLVSVGAGTGHMEVELSAAGWEICATDCASSALAVCAAKGLSVAGFCLTEDPPLGAYDVIYCDGVLGHLWTPEDRCARAWQALAGLGRPRSICLVANELADASGVQFAVRSDPQAQYYRPPPHVFAEEAVRTGFWEVEKSVLYRYVRAGIPRRREILALRLLMYDGIEPEDRS